LENFLCFVVEKSVWFPWFDTFTDFSLTGQPGRLPKGEGNPPLRLLPTHTTSISGSRRSHDRRAAGRLLALSRFEGIVKIRLVDRKLRKPRSFRHADPAKCGRNPEEDHADARRPGRATRTAARGGVLMNAGRTEKEKEQARVHIRWMIRRDMPEVLQTEQLSFEYAWTEEDFLRCLRQRNCIGMVAEHGEKVVGFMIYELHKNKLHILNFAVHPAWRRMGVGAQMVAKLISKLSSHRRTRITLEVRETNLAAQLFFHKQEFKAIRVLRAFYEDSGEDAFLMEYRFGDEVGDDLEETVNRIAQYEEN
jgi:ribosomal-protein-alanine N-acetyltransferase